MAKSAVLILSALALVAGPALAASPPEVPRGVFANIDAPVDFSKPVQVSDDYRLGPLDKISVKVFGQENLSVEKIQVDASGVVVLPLIGAVRVGGRTSREVSTEIANRLGENYLNAPNVSVLIEEAVSQRVTVTGAVIEAGMYPLKGPTTLLQAVSMAKGPDTKVADLKKIEVFRVIDGQRKAALFDYDSIRRGQSIDPEIYGDDIIVVPASASKSTWREFVTAMPALGVFALLK